MLNNETLGRKVERFVLLDSNRIVSVNKAEGNAWKNMRGRETTMAIIRVWSKGRGVYLKTLHRPALFNPEETKLQNEILREIGKKIYVEARNLNFPTKIGIV